jgi:phage antirepressor YoqD-like protein
MIEELKNKIIEKAHEDKANLKELAKSLYISERQLKLLLKSWGVVLTHKRKYVVVEMPEREELMKKYNEVGNTTELAKVYNVGINTVNRWMKKMGIPTKKLNKFKDEKEKVDFLESHLGKLKNLDL